MAAPAEFLQSLRLLFLQCRPLLQECGELPGRRNALLKTSQEGVDANLRRRQFEYIDR